MIHIPSNRPHLPNLTNKQKTKASPAFHIKILTTTTIQTSDIQHSIFFAFYPWMTFHVDLEGELNFKHVNFLIKS